MAALMVMPTVLCAVLLALGIDGRVALVGRQQRTARAVAAALGLQAVAAALEAESSPALVSVGTRPGGALSPVLSAHLAADYGPDELRATRAATDHAFTALPAAARTSPGVRSAKARVATIRAAVDTGTQTLAQTFDAYLGAAAELGALEQSQLDAAMRDGSTSDTAQALQQLAAATRVVSTADKLDRIAVAYRFRMLDGSDAATTRTRFLQTWGAYRSLAADFPRQATGSVLARWHAAQTSPAAAHVAAVYETRALQPPVTEALTGAVLGNELALKRNVDAQEAGLRAVSQQAADIAQHSIENLESRATTWLWVVSSAAGAALIVLVTVLVLVTRAVTRPLRQLAQEAEQVSHGVLVDVQPSGPPEVRVVGEALRSAVAHLRRWQSQVEAVARGDLTDPTLEQPLPGRLGEAMHSSVDAVVTTLRERDVLQEQLAHQATHDALTELPNRAETYRRVEGALQRTRRTTTTVGLLFLDLDGFKATNDTYGHHAGDHVLVTVAQRLLGLVRAGDTVGRLGGDEFVVVTETVRQRDDLHQLAVRVAAAVAIPVPLPEGAIAQVGVSIGAAMEFDGFVSAAQFMVGADMALYRAKSAGGGIVFADEASPVVTGMSAFVTFGQSADQ